MKFHFSFRLTIKYVIISVVVLNIFVLYFSESVFRPAAGEDEQVGRRSCRLRQRTPHAPR